MSGCIDAHQRWQSGRSRRWRPVTVRLRSSGAGTVEDADDLIRAPGAACQHCPDVFGKVVQRDQHGPLTRRQYQPDVALAEELRLHHRPVGVDSPGMLPPQPFAQCVTHSDCVDVTIDPAFRDVRMTIPATINESDARTMECGASQQLIQASVGAEVGDHQVATVNQHCPAPGKPPIPEVVTDVDVAGDPLAVHQQEAFPPHQHRQTIAAGRGRDCRRPPAPGTYGQPSLSADWCGLISRPACGSNRVMSGLLMDTARGMNRWVGSHPGRVPAADMLGVQVLSRRAMAIGNRQRRAERRPRVKELFERKDVDAALDLLHLTDMAWHDCFGPRELEVPPRVLDDILLLAEGDLATLIRIAREAVIDFRDVRMAADDKRAETSERS